MDKFLILKQLVGGKYSRGHGFEMPLNFRQIFACFYIVLIEGVNIFLINKLKDETWLMAFFSVLTTIVLLLSTYYWYLATITDPTDRAIYYQRYFIQQKDQDSLS